MGKKKSTPASPAAAGRRREPRRKPAAPLEKAEISAPSKISGSQFKSAASEERAETQPSGSISFPIVGIGASAGGLEAFTQLLEHLPLDTGMAFVLVQHLAPRHESMLTELLSRATSMPVNEVIDGTPVEPNHVYVIPPNTDMAILQSGLRLLPRPEGHGQQHMPIDHFLRSLAEDQKSRAIGVILSGTASDGALGLKAIKAEGGITFAQDEATAKYHGMPRSAIAAGYVDFILPPNAIAQELTRIGRHPYVNRVKPESLGELSEDETNFNKILAFLRSATSVDFTHYKPMTIKRRIMRRMVLHKIDDLKNYVRYLQTDTKEVAALYNDILINVTGFFRDQETFQSLVEKVFPVIMENRPADEPIRIWVPGCSTGEEPYSIAICLLEYLGDRATNTPIQIFATDISDMAIDKARSGIYLENISAEVSKERLRRFFVKLANGYQITKTIRDICVFARQNVTKDPPFSKLDLISCRNVLIYLGPALQKKVMPIFHYALKPTGFLMLGSSETIGGFSDLFALMDKKHKVYAKKATMHRPHLEFSASQHTPAPVELGKKTFAKEWGRFDLQKEADQIVLRKFAPAGVIINDDGEILQFRGRTGPYLEPASGEASLNLFRMTREGLLFDLRTAFHKARKDEAPVKKQGLEVTYNGHTRKINLEVIPIKMEDSRERYFLVLFEDFTPLAAPELKKAKPKAAQPDKTKSRGRDAETAHLKEELRVNKEYLQSIVEEQEATNEELRSANEEIQSSNEELQSTNEELETAKEELQSTNEELTTLNEELENRNFELSQANNDLLNLLGSVHIPIVMLGSDLRIRRFTPMAEKAFNVIPTDVGRKISDIKPNVNIPDLEKLVLDVADTLRTVEREVQDQEGHWYSLRLRPYKTAENKIEGVVITLVDINLQKRSVEELEGHVLERTVALQAANEALQKEIAERQKTETNFRRLVEAAPDAMVIANREGRIVLVNSQTEKLFGYSREEMLDQPVETLLPEHFRERYAAHRAGYFADPRVRPMRTGLDFFARRKDGTEFPVEISLSVLETAEGVLVASAIRDITERKQAEKAMRFAESIVETVREPLVVLDSDLRVEKANRAFYQTFQVAKEETENRRIYELGNRQWDIPKLRQLLEEILPDNSFFENFEVEHDFPRLGRRKMLLNASQLERQDGRAPMILLAIEDITERAEPVR